MKTQNKCTTNAFTLAEVLITLGIIGVVAAMTIPNLMANIQGSRVRTQFKKAISTLNQAAKMNVANYDWDFATINQYRRYCDGSDHPETKTTFCALINANLTGTTFLGNSRTSIPDYDLSKLSSETSFGDYIRYQLQDGTIISVNDMFSGRCTKEQVMSNPWDCVGFIDINGKQLPNKRVECDNPSDTKPIWDSSYKDCAVKMKGGIGDTFDVLFYDSTVEPATNAGRYVLHTSK